MKSPKQHCPRCNAQQSFRPQSRDTAAPKGHVRGTPAVIEIYIRCTTCHWEQRLRLSTLELEHLAGNETRLLQRGRVEEARYGVAKGSTSKLLQTVRKEMARCRVEAGLA